MCDLGPGPQGALRTSQRIILRHSRLDDADHQCGHGVFGGEVVGFDAGEGLWKVRYGDGDGEEPTADELRPLLVA